jgi:lipopolysaccharide export system protein LptA
MRASLNLIPLFLLGGCLLILGSSFDVRTGSGVDVRDTTRTREVHIVSADELVQEVRDGEQVRSLRGNVFLRQGETELRASQAIQYLDRDEIHFTGNVRIFERGDSLWADRVVYNRIRRQGHATGRVRLTDGEVVVSAPEGTYYTRDKWASFERGVSLVDSNSVMTSRRGLYFSEEKRAEFFGDVLLEQDRSTVTADTVVFFRETEQSQASGSVRLRRLGGRDNADGQSDSLTVTYLVGESLFNDNRAGYSRAEGLPLMLQIRRDSTDSEPDTLAMRAKRLELQRSDTTQTLIAVGEVRMWRKDFAAVADSLVYERIGVDDDTDEAEHEEVRMYLAPMAWFEMGQVNGDSLRLTARFGSVDSLLVRGNAFLAQEDTSLSRIQQIQGLHITGLFREDTLRTVVIGPNAEAVYYLKKDDDTGNGVITLSGDQMIFHIEDEKLKRLVASPDVEGVHYGQDDIPNDLRLDRYTWVPESRPLKDDLLDHPLIRIFIEQLPPVAERSAETPSPSSNP